MTARADSPPALAARADWERLLVLLRYAYRGAFVFALQDDPHTRDQLAGELRAQLTHLPLFEFTLHPEHQTTPLAYLERMPPEMRAQPAVIILDGLESLDRPVWAELDAQREALAARPHRLIFWLTEAGLRRAIDYAPNVWSRRSGGVFDLRVRPAPTPAPAEPIPVFVERGELLEAVAQRLRERRHAAIVGVRGMGGVGKTYLAYELYRRLKAEGRDGLWITVSDRPTAQVQNEIAHALGAELASRDEAGRAAELQALLRRLPRIVFFDDVRAGFDLRPCLPPSPPCAALVTSRSLELPGLPPDSIVQLDVMTPEQALALLHACEPLRPRLEREPEDASRLIELCGYLPLALTLAARYLLGHPDLTLAGLNRQLREGQSRLSAEAYGGLRAHFDLSYQALSPSDQARWRKLAVFAPSGFGIPAAAALWAASEADASEALYRLEGASMLLPPSPVGEAVRFRLHDLLRDYAAEQLRQAGEADAAHRAHAQWLVDLFERRYTDDPGAAPDVALELDNLRAAAQWALAEAKDGELLARLATQPRNWLYNVFRINEEWLMWLNGALHLGIEDRGLRANVLKAIGDVQQFRDERDAALQSYAQALGLFRAVGDRLGEANVLQAIGDVQQFRKENDAALQSYAQALQLFRQVGAKVGEANVLLSSGGLKRQEGNASGAQSDYESALNLYRLIGDRYSMARALYRLGDCAADRKDWKGALKFYEQAAELWRAIQVNDLVEQILAPRIAQARQQIHS
jgi:tetratricopeptide (TPR) repeat protein